MRQLIFVYNADSGFFNTLSDIAHKITSPDSYACQLCQLTHGHFTMRSQWQQFLDETNVECKFFHRDEFRKQYGEQDVALPAIFVDTDQGVELLISKSKIESLQTVDELIALVQQL